ncbi:unnamed protein product [Diabrotica balteata]|uniref:Protein arginine N-methyltransferase domain-containing protein n=1 Tax=Diabrotica balteata TaxID=107213 RepID=A0A9N9SZ90_DIABA|nr:unnamed protein product [Diabrotica balteata]
MAGRVPRLGDYQKKNNSIYYLKKAKQACVKNDFAEAYENFVLYFESLNDPAESTSAVQTVFTKLVCKMGAVLEETSNIEELLKCYIQALNLFPDNYVILNNLGAYMFKISEVDIARRYLERAVNVNKNYLPAEINLMRVKWHQIPRWHFRMLNDKGRNLAYDEAIREVIENGYKNVIDIGAGCGLLSLIAAEMPGTSVIAIEENKQLYNLCVDIMKKNEVSNVKVLQCYSLDIEEVLDKCNFLVTEVFDCGLFGERALETIYHASKMLRTEEDYKIVPCGAKLYITGISCEDQIKRHKLVNKKSIKLLNLQNVCVTEYDLEPYEAENLLDKEVKYVTDINQVFDLDFYNLEQINELLSEDGHEKIIQLRCIEQGVLHAFAIWFDLNLTPNTYITNNPLDDDQVTCWEHAIICLDHPVEVVEGTIITAKLTIKDCGLNVTLIETEPTNHTCFKVSKEVITFLNDQKLVDNIIALLKKVWNANTTVIDNNICPLLGFLLAKTSPCTVYHPIKTEADKAFFDYVLNVNNIPKENFLIVNELEIKGQNSCTFFFDTVNVDGSLENCCLAKNELGSSIYIPQSVTIVVQLISSSYIDFCNKVDDDNVFGFNIAEFINDYSGYEHPNLERLMYKEHSPPVKFPLEGDGEKSKDVIVTRGGETNALLLWYELQFYEDIVYSTLNSIHYKKTCFFFNEPKKIELGDGISIKMQINGTYMKFYI